MNDPRRLLEDGNELEQALLRSALHDEPAPGSEQPVMFALGLVPSGVIGIPGLAPAAGIASGSTAGSVAGAAVKLGAWSIVRWVGIGALAGTATLGGVRALNRSVGDAPAPQTSQDAPNALASTSAPVLPAPHSAEAPRTAESTSPPRRIEASPSVPTSDPSLAAEVAALDRAHKALESDDPAAALRAIEERERAHPNGVLNPEALLVRIEAHMKMGQRQAGQQLGRQFLARYPEHPLSNRVRALMTEPDSGPAKQGANP